MAADDGAKQLERALGAPPPAGLLAALDDAELERLAAAVEDAGERQSAALAAALQDALDQVPRLLRGVVRRIVLG